MEKTKTHFEDYQLVHRYLCDDAEAGQELYINAIPKLERYVQKHAAKGGFTPDDVKDIVSESLKRSIEKLAQYNGNSKFTSWVIGIAKNVMYEELRNKKKEILVEDIENVIELDFTKDISLYSQDPLRIVIRKEIIGDVQDAFQCLSPEHKDIIKLRFMRQVPAKIVAQMLGESVSAINSRYLRAVKAWRKNIKEKF